MTQETVEQVMNAIENSGFFHRYGRKMHWQVNSTVCYPITHYAPNEEIDVALDGHDNRGIISSAKHLVKELKKISPDITNFRFIKWDGSCPDEIRIYYK